MKGRLGAAGKWDLPGVPGECMAEPVKGQSPPREGWAAGVLTALQGSCWGQLTFLQTCRRPSKAEVQGGLRKFAEAGTCPLAIDLIGQRCSPGSSALLGEVEGLTCLQLGQETSEDACPLQYDLWPNNFSIWGCFDEAGDVSRCCQGIVGVRKQCF